MAEFGPSFQVRRPSGTPSASITDLGAWVAEGDTRDLSDTRYPHQIKASASLDAELQAGTLIRVKDGVDVPYDEAYEDLEPILGITGVQSALLALNAFHNEVEATSTLINQYGSDINRAVYTFDESPPDELDVAASSNWTWDAETHELRADDPTQPTVLEFKNQRIANGSVSKVGCMFGVSGTATTGPLYELTLNGSQWHTVTAGDEVSPSGWSSSRRLGVRITFTGLLAYRWVGLICSRGFRGTFTT